MIDHEGDLVDKYDGDYGGVNGFIKWGDEYGGFSRGD